MNSQFGNDSAHANPSQLHSSNEHSGSGVGGVYDSAHHSAYGYNSLPPGYNQHGGHSGHMGMYAYHPAAMYAGFNPSSMVNPAVMSGHGSSSANSASQAGQTGSAAQQGAATGTGADGSSNAPGHYMSYPGHPHFFQPGMLPNMMQGSGASGVHYGQQGSTQHPSMHSAGNYGQFAQNVASAGSGKKAATAGAKQGRPKKKKEADPAAVAMPQAMMTYPAADAARAKAESKKKAAAEEKARKEKEAKKALRSRLKQPKQAPSAWQLFFTEELAKMRAAKPEERLNVAHVAKGAGERYNSLPDSEKAKYQNKSVELKAQWERDMQTWKESLSPEDIKAENAFRTQQRKAGKSRKSNLKDPHAPKKPLSAYFLFLRAIRADPKMTDDVFGKESETTKQSVLAATRWRELTEGEKAPYLAKAEQDKTRYEEARRVYEQAQNEGMGPADAAAHAAIAGKAAAAKMNETHPALQNLPLGLRGELDHDDMGLVAGAHSKKEKK